MGAGEDGMRVGSCCQNIARSVRETFNCEYRPCLGWFIEDLWRFGKETKRKIGKGVDWILHIGVILVNLYLSFNYCRLKLMFPIIGL